MNIVITGEVPKPLPKPEVIEEVQKTPYERKCEAKKTAKAAVNKKFIVGDIYFLKNNKVRKDFICKKYIYSINDEIVNIVVMKQIAGPQGHIYTLAEHDCKRYHIKFEEGLQVFAMSLNWVHKRNKK